MTEIIDDDRGNTDALAAFARASDDSKTSREVTIPSTAFSGVDRVVGAQEVAVYRNLERVLQNIASLAAAAGDAWYYRYPVRNRGATNWIEGPSIKLANDVARIYGNCDVDVRVQDLGSSWVIYARFQDYETGFAMTRPFQQNKGGSKLGGSDDARRLDIAFQIGVSKAIRNVVVNALQTFVAHGLDAAKHSLVEKIGKKLDSYRDRTVMRLEEMGGSELVKRVERIQGRPRGQWLAPHIARIIAEITAINDGMSTIDETWPVMIDEDGVIQDEPGDDTGDETAQPERKKRAPRKKASAEPKPQPKDEDKAPAENEQPKPKPEPDEPPEEAKGGEEISDELPADDEPSRATETATAPVETVEQPKPERPPLMARMADFNKKLSPDRHAHLRELHSSLMKATGARQIGLIANNFYADRNITEGSTFAGAVDEIEAMHNARLAGHLTEQAVQVAIDRMLQS